MKMRTCCVCSVVRVQQIVSATFAAPGPLNGGFSPL